MEKEKKITDSLDLGNKEAQWRNINKNSALIQNWLGKDGFS